jgi:hypothetical protein
MVDLQTLEDQMSLDIIEIALDGLTDHRDFEKLASEIMRDEGYPDIKPLGGGDDMGQDAIQESYFQSEGPIRTVFQYTLQEYLPSKIDDTIVILAKNKITYQELVIVTRHSISSQSQDNMIRETRKKHGVNLRIFERKILVNRLANYENGIFHRHFSNIVRQVTELTSKKPLLSEDNIGSLECSKLKASIVFTFSKRAGRARKSIFDFLILGLLLENPNDPISVEKLINKYKDMVGGRQLPSEKINAALDRLIALKLVERHEDGFRPTNSAVETAASSTIQANEDTQCFISDMLDEVHQISGRKLSDQDKRTIGRNIRDVLIMLFRLSGIELSNQVLRERTPSPVYLDSFRELVAAAKRQIPSEIGELLISVISEKLKNPTEEQAQTLANWSLAYVGVEIMNLDPDLTEFQTTRFSKKTFILDTDFVLDCLVQECPWSNTHRNLIRTLINLGCSVIIPESCLQECITHAFLSPRTYNHFGEKLLALSDSFICEYVGNVFVKGYYYGRINSRISPKTTFEKYLENYYESSAPIPFLRSTLQATLPEGIQILNPTILLNEPIPSDKMLVLRAELLEQMRKSKKSEYRTPEENKQLATTDAQLFLTALLLNCQDSVSWGHILGGHCYLITESSRYLRCAKRVGLKDVVTTRPQSLMALLELIGGIKITPTEFVSLFENPMLIYAVDQAWVDVQVLLESGIVLRSKSIGRLRWDLDQELHRQIAALSEADAREESEEEPVELDAGDSEYLQLLKSAASRGYPRIPLLDSLMEDLEKAQKEVKAKSKAFEELLLKYEEIDKTITHFGKRKQRYLRSIARKKFK